MKMDFNQAIIVGVIIGLVVVASGIYAHDALVLRTGTQMDKAGVDAGTLRNGSEIESSLPLEVIHEDLEVISEIGFLPNGDMLVVLRGGFINWVSGEERMSFEIEDVYSVGEGGLLGLAIHPDFIENGLIYVYFTAGSRDAITNKVVRFRLTAEGLEDKEVMIEEIPGSRIHNGGRIAFGPDGFLYVTTGDAGDPNLAQDISSLAGKILRIDENGQVPATNPYQNFVYSYGHRNPQGLAWDNRGRLWSTEHGATGNDEINLIEAGQNYGWPIIEGDQSREGMRRPALHSSRQETWAPAGLAIIDDVIYFGGLRGSALFEVRGLISGDGEVQVIPHFKDVYGRIRAVKFHNDSVYFSTSNRDGRGNPRLGDDKVIRVNPESL
jgi:glucose/arabinose dehydrogenase